MNPNRASGDRRAATLIGILYLVGTLALVASFVVTGGLVTVADPLSGIAAARGAVTAGALLVLVSGLALGLVPVVFWPVGRRHGETLAIGGIVVRGAIETVLYLVSALCWLLLVALSVDPGAGTAALADLVQAADAILWSQLIPIPFVLGALLFNALLHRSRLVPRWLSTWGLAGAVLYLGGPLGAMTGLQLGVLMAPLAVQEMVLAVRLIARGFDPVASGVDEAAAVPPGLRAELQWG